MSDVKHCHIDDLGICITGTDAEHVVEACNQYLYGFASGSSCPNCGATLGGLMGSFRWGIAHGEGNCNQCGWPCRAYHNIKDDVGALFNRPIEFVLAYHPDFVTKQETSDV